MKRRHRCSHARGVKNCNGVRLTAELTFSMMKVAMVLMMPPSMARIILQGRQQTSGWTTSHNLQVHTMWHPQIGLRLLERNSQ
jgi:hypothetical protein